MDTYYNKKISDFDLCGTQYSIEVLTKHMHYLNKKVVLNTQYLTAHFCVRFILDMDIESGSEDSYYYDKNHILSRQKHITSEEFDKAYELYYK
jgi:hypothetical protein